MRVVDHEPQWWFLLEEEGALFLVAFCDHSFVGYEFMIQLIPEEVAKYHTKGREFIKWLAEDIQNSVPILKISMSPYKERKASEALSKRALAAISEWKPGVLKQ